MFGKHSELHHKGTYCFCQYTCKEGTMKKGYSVWIQPCHVWSMNMILQCEKCDLIVLLYTRGKLQLERCFTWVVRMEPRYKIYLLEYVYTCMAKCWLIYHTSVRNTQVGIIKLWWKWINPIDCMKQIKDTTYFNDKLHKLLSCVHN